MTPLPHVPATDRAHQDHAARRSLLLIPLAAFVAILPLLVHGSSCGHDFDFHLLSWLEATSQFSHGNLHPHWAYTPAFDAGEPRFVFYPPLSWGLGALLGLLLTHLPGVSPSAGWSAAPICFTWITLTISGFTFHRLARAFTGNNAALLAAIVYLANPYMLFTAYERSADGELLAAAWIPLLFLAILRDKITIPGIALPVAFLWLTNVPAAVMGSYTLSLLAAVRLAAELRASRRRPALQLALRSAAGTALGLALAAFYIVPAAYERRFIQIARVNISGMRIEDNFLFGHTGTSVDAQLHDEVLHTASLIAVSLLIATAVALAAIFLRRKQQSRLRARLPVLPLAVLTAGIAVLLTPVSTPLWSHAPEAAFLQFPWRLTAVAATAFALAFAASVDNGESRDAASTPLAWLERLPFAIPICAIALAAALILPAYHVFHQPCDAEDTAAARCALFQSRAGTDPTDEYTPTEADNDALKLNDPPFWLAPGQNDTAPGIVPVSQPTDSDAPEPKSNASLVPMHFTVTAPVPEDLILNLRDYPAWRIYLNGALDSAREQRDDGLIAFPVPTGVSTIDIRYARTPDQTLGDATSLLALLVLLTPLVLRRTHR